MDLLLPSSLDSRSLQALSDVMDGKDLEERDRDARVWTGIAITALLIILSSGLVLRFGPIIHFQNEIVELNYSGDRKVKW